MQPSTGALAARRRLNPINPRSVLIAFVSVVVVIIFNMIMLASSIIDTRDHETSLERTNEVIQHLETAMSYMKDAETGQRGFSLTGLEVFLEPYRNGRLKFGDELNTLRALLAARPVQVARIDHIAQLAEENLAFHEQAIETRRVKGLEGAVQAVSSGRGKDLMDAIRKVADELREDEHAALAVKAEESRRASDRVDWTLLASTAISLVLATTAYYYIRATFERERKERERLSREAWLRGGLSDFANGTRAETSVLGLGGKAMTFFSDFLGMMVGSLYVVDRGDLALAGAIGPDARAGAAKFPTRLDAGRGLTGEAIRQRRRMHLRDVPPGYLKISSSTGDADPRELIVMPVMFEGEAVAVLELGSLHPIRDDQLEFLDEAQRILGTSLSAVIYRQRQQELLEETQRQAEELQAQQEELRATNSELEAQANALRESQQHLQVQQEELRQSNEELEQQTRALDAQKEALASHNAVLADTKRQLETKASELELASRYKSEFLSNMSHELRTPLNSMLLLSTLLAENKGGRLSDQQIEWSQTIYQAGNSLLTLINDILDLSKVEAGKIDILAADTDPADVAESMKRTFASLAEQKGLAFAISVQADVPAKIQTDRLRLEQILKNLLSNAVKFTNEGRVDLDVRASAHGVDFVVRDTGIGVAAENLGTIFDAFQQADGSTSRSYGGTGLGLTISRELAHLLGGEILVESEPGKGSCFTLRAPHALPASSAARQPRESARAEARPASSPKPGVVDGGADAAILGDVGVDADRRVLIIEDDVPFGKAMVELAHDAGFKAVLATTGQAGISYAESNPVVAVLLDMQLPDCSGLVVLEKLKRSPKTRHLPVHVISAMDFSLNALKFGAVGYLRKPTSKKDLQGVFGVLQGVISRTPRRILVIEDDKMQREAVRDLLGNGDLKVDEAATAKEALAALERQTYDCLVLDLKLPDMSGFDLLERIKQGAESRATPVVVYTGKDLSRDEQERLDKVAESIVIKGARSPERLLDEVTLFLHRVEDRLPADSQQLLEKMRLADATLSGRRVMVVDDDMRNVYALVASLESAGMKTLVARNGKEALQKLEIAESAPDLVLMDIMMPVMDGYETMRHIRAQTKFKRLPIIALTAKAMRGDIDSCLAAGANDYLAKPVQLDQLLSLIRVWVPQRV